MGDANKFAGVGESADAATIAYYETHADEFVAGTASADMSAIFNRFVQLLPSGGSVLDWGCGSGRDARRLAQLGFAVTASDGSRAMCEAASSSDAIVRNEGFLDLADVSAFDGIWACASLLHLHRSQLAKAVTLAWRALKPSGVLYASFKHGSFEGVRNGRYFTDLSEEDIPALLPADKWDLVETWRSGDVREGRGAERWLNFIARKA